MAPAGLEALNGGGGELRRSENDTSRTLRPWRLSLSSWDIRQEVAISVPELHVEHNLVTRHALAQYASGQVLEKLLRKPSQDCASPASPVSGVLTDAGGCPLSARLLGPVLAKSPPPLREPELDSARTAPPSESLLSVGRRSRVAPQGEGRQVDVATVDLPGEAAKLTQAIASSTHRPSQRACEFLRAAQYT